VCGIVGWADFERDLTAEGTTLAAMTDTMACRGPDGSGTWVTPRAALGHRRLAVIDLVGGAQPFAEGEVALVFSGEVYNFTGLRAELASRGHRFVTRSDTEVVFRAYLQWGPESVERLEGMFAFAVWDGRIQQLLLARDRLGVKPLYYAEHGSGLLFGSEPKAILANPLYTPELGADGLCELFGMWPFITPGAAIFKGMRELLPAHVLTVDARGSRLRRYWALESAEHPDNEEQTIATVRRLLAGAVDRQLVADVPIGFLLSGGLDSSFVTALAAASPERGSGKLATFSVDFTDSAEDFQAHAAVPSLDAPYIARMVEHLDAAHTDIVIDAGVLAALEEDVVRARDLPSLGDIDMSLLLLCRELRGYATVAVSGESADEVFGGYTWFADGAADTFPWLDPTIGHPWVRPELRSLLNLDEYVRDRYSQALAEVPRLPGESGVDRRIREIFHLAISRHLPAMLARKDRMSMAAGLEVRVPYCDHRLVEYAWNIPWRMKRLGGREKGILRAASGDLLPADVRARRKSRYPSPQSPAYVEAIWERARHMVSDESSPMRPLLHLPNMKWLFGRDLPPDQRAALSTPLASFLTIETWLRLYHVRIR
jgi:asparagine synthase (glutamine-hydrolysing)